MNFKNFLALTFNVKVYEKSLLIQIYLSHVNYTTDDLPSSRPRIVIEHTNINEDQVQLLAKLPLRVL